MSSYEIKYFPFCKGIGWKCTSVIKPKLDGDSWNRAVSDRTPIITCFGGLYEHYFSLSIIEALNKILPSKKVYFNGDEKFNALIKLNGISLPENLITPELVKNYPLPLFFDEDDNVYFNVLFNYLEYHNVVGEVIFKNKNSISKQIFINSCLDWNISYTPQLRNLTEPLEFTKWKESKKFNIDKPFVLIFPDSTDLSMHSVSMLDWSIAQVKSFVSMCSGSGIHTVIITKNGGRYTGINSLVIPPNLEQILYLIQKCNVILSNEIDFLLLSLILSKNATVFARDQKHRYSIKYNQKFLQTDKKIIQLKTLNPLDVFKAIK